MTHIPAALSVALAERYHLVRELGRGAMASVYLAEDVKHRRRVAVKVLHPEITVALGATRFAREIEIVAGLAHPHILTLIDSGDAAGYLYYTMPLVDGGSLRDLLVEKRRLALRDALRLVDQVASALQSAHEHGVVHRDIKPENILLAGDQAVVADFGIARAAQVAGGERLTQTGMSVGTPAYMSPEQAFGQDDVDHRADIYALGIVLFEMLAGRLPFVAQSPRALLAQHATGLVPSLCHIDSTVPLFVDRAVRKALAKDPADRFDSARQFAETLRSETVVAPAGRRRLAVLPPVNMSNDPEQQYLVLGLHEALISEVGRGDVAVVARTSVLQYQGTDKSVRDICRELSVDAVVESSLFRTGKSVGVQARLIDGHSEEGIWSGSYDGNVENVFSLFRELCGSIAAEMHGALAPTPQRSYRATTVNPVAYENYMRGRVHQQSFNPADFDRALQYYQAALALQPDYAAAYSGIALIWGSKSVLGLVPGYDAGPKWLETARRAVELDPNLAEGHQALGQAFAWFEFDWDRAESAFRRAIELDPNEPQARIFYSHLLAMLRRAEESDVQIARALEIDRFNAFTQMLYGVQLGLIGRHEHALEQLAKIPPNPLASWATCMQHFACGRLHEGLLHYARYFEMLGDAEIASAMRENADNPQAAMILAAEMLAARSLEMFVKPNNIVHLFSWGGDIDRAVEWLERSLEMRDHEVAYLAAVPASSALRADSRFHAILRRLKLPLPRASA